MTVNVKYGKLESFFVVVARNNPLKIGMCALHWLPWSTDDDDADESGLPNRVCVCVVNVQVFDRIKIS